MWTSGSELVVNGRTDERINGLLNENCKKLSPFMMLCVYVIFTPFVTLHSSCLFLLLVFFCKHLKGYEFMLTCTCNLKTGIRFGEPYECFCTLMWTFEGRVSKEDYFWGGSGYILMLVLFRDERFYFRKWGWTCLFRFILLVKFYLSY